ncbi:MAG TPA: DUF3011 domain-containing protein [Bryobacteraceae bacterium]|nr:DUF3011 domain-containing protein [Bryobacteraceae bacterium]
MNRRPVLLIATTVCFLAVQAGAQAQTLKCSSDDGRRHTCSADTRGGVRVVRQISGSPCTQGMTWGYDANGIWVDRGCRAEFEVLPYSSSSYASAGTIRCSSDDERRHTCSADTRGGVRMVRQISGSPCTQGRTWGYDANGIWVDRGCRAEFEVLPYSSSSYASAGTIRCSSDDERRHTCSADTRGGVRMVRQISGSPCTQGRTWGYDANSIWVDRGCRAEFEVVPYAAARYGSPGSSRSGITTMNCSSDDGRRHVCPADTRRRVRIVRQLSGSACREGYSWGYDADGIWVDHGCRAEFEIRGGFRR